MIVDCWLEYMRPAFVGLLAWGALYILGTLLQRIYSWLTEYTNNTYIHLVIVLVSTTSLLVSWAALISGLLYSVYLLLR